MGCAMGTLGADCTGVFDTTLGTACVGGVDATLGTAGRIVGAGSGALGVLCALDDFEASIVAASFIALIFLNGATSLSGDSLFLIIVLISAMVASAFWLRRGDRRSNSMVGLLYTSSSGFGREGRSAMSGSCAVILLVISASCSRSLKFTPLFLAPAVAPFVMLLIELTKDPRALITQSA